MGLRRGLGSSIESMYASGRIDERQHDSLVDRLRKLEKLQRENADRERGIWRDLRRMEELNALNGRMHEEPVRALEAD